MSEAVILIGAQGSGKSFFFKCKFYDTHVRINLDMLKTRNRENIIFHACLAAQQPLVVDNTNATRLQRAHYIQLAKHSGYQVTAYYIEVPLGECMANNKLRVSPIPDVGVAATHAKLQEPGFCEGFDKIFKVTVTSLREFIITQIPTPEPVHGLGD